MKDFSSRRKDSSALMWKSGERKELLKTPIFSVCSVMRSSRDGSKKGSFVTINTTDWVVVIPWFRDESGRACFLMESQYRHGTDSVVTEFPGGLVDEGEDAETAARRELLEETGCTGRITMLGSVSPNAAFMENRQYFFLAENLEKKSGQSLDENEEIDVFALPVQDVVSAMGSGEYDNGTMMMALAYFLREAEKRPDLRA